MSETSDPSIRHDKPILSGYSPFSEEHMADPYPMYRRARQESPVFYSDELGSWVLTRYRDVQFVYEHPEIFSSSEVIRPRSPMPASLARELAGWTPPFAHQVVMADPPKHTRLKRLMMKAFTPGRVSKFESWIRDIVTGLLRDFESEKQVDLVSVYTSLVPTDVIGKVLGVETRDSRRFRQWVRGIVLLAGRVDVSDEEQVIAWRSIREFDEYGRHLVAQRRSHPQEDVVSYLIEATTDDGAPALSDEEVVHSVINIAGAGADTTGNLIAMALYLLLRQPDRWEAIRRDRTLIPVALEESLRYGNIVRGLARRTLSDVEIEGVRIPKGEFIYIALASANRDEAAFVDPDTFDIHRPGVRNHLAFGKGAHTCLGISLARLEAKIAVEALLDRFPGIALGDRSASLQFEKNTLIPGIKRLVVNLR